ncbi:MAG: GAF and ANTAR domain-containing protein [Microbacteriaceae bacterium]|nr:GAF and ANTAR domain-containing protein [Microbacteriaceae bacterium]
MAEVSREQLITEAFVTVADTLIDDYDVIDLLHTLVDVCTSVLDVDAGGLLLADESGDLQLVASTSERADFVEIMQLAAGVGPCLDCFSGGMPVSVADIDRGGEQWPAFQSAALLQGFHAVYATPLRLWGKVLGAMNLFRSTPGELNAPDAAVAQALADVATIGILQERSIRETGIVTEQLQRALESRILIEQAKGVLSAMGRMSVDEAFEALRTYARRNNLPLRVVAEGVASRTLDVLEPNAFAPRHKSE